MKMWLLNMWLTIFLGVPKNLLVRLIVEFVMFSLGNLSKDRQRFVDAIVLIFAIDWWKRLSNFENVVQTPFELGLRTLNDGRFCQTVFRT